MTSINWIIEWMLTTPATAEPPHCVLEVSWRCNGADGRYTGTAYGVCRLSAPGEGFTPYADLTKEDVLGWCWANGVDRAEIEYNVAQQIEVRRNPPVIRPTLPWADTIAPGA